MSNYITPSTVYTIRNGAKEALTQDEKKIFNRAKVIINDFIDDKKLILTYRGEQKSRMRKRLNETDDFRMFSKIFHIGEKGCHFYMDDGYDVNGQEPRDYIKDINDVSENTFSYIFRTINNMIIDNFEYENNFKEYFSNTNNLNNFVQKISNLSNQVKIKVRDYYYAYLHTLGHRGVGNFSHFVSTSKN